MLEREGLAAAACRGSERYGFKRTGDLHGNETLLRLEIS
jgi:hypothetical protein